MVSSVNIGWSKSDPLSVWARNTVIDWVAIIASLLLLVYKLAGGLNTTQLGNLASSWIQLKKKIYVLSTVGEWS